MFWLKIKQTKKRKQTRWKFQDKNCSLFSFHFNGDFHGTQTWNMGCISFWTGEDTGRGESRYLMTWKVNGGVCSAYTDIPVPVTCRCSHRSSTCLLGHLDSPKDPGPLKNARHLRFWVLLPFSSQGSGSCSTYQVLHSTRAGNVSDVKWNYLGDEEY